MNLDENLEQFHTSLRQATDLVLELYRELESRTVYPDPNPAQLRESFDRPLPEEGLSFDLVLQEVRQKVFSNATLNISPRFMASIIGGGSQAGIAAEMLIAALNQNCSLWYRGPSAAELERLVIKWLAAFIGYPEDCGGILTSGGTAASLVALAVCRKMQAPVDVAVEGLYAAPAMTMYVSGEGHSCIEKVIDLLGLGRRQLRKLPVLADFTVDPDVLAAAIEKDRRDGFCPIAVIGNAGSGNTGAIDPLDRLADLCEKEKLWFHVDAAYGGAAARVEGLAEQFRGLERADSVAIDPQKWMHVPFEVGCVLVKDRKALKNTFSLLPHYLESGFGSTFDPNYMEYGPQLTRSFRALKVWVVLKTYGARRLRQAIRNNIDNMRFFADLVETASDFELLATGPLSIVCFRYRTDSEDNWKKEAFLNELNRRMIEAHAADGRYLIASTVINGSFALRAANVNHRTERRHLQGLLEHLRVIGRSCAEKSGYEES